MKSPSGGATRTVLYDFDDFEETTLLNVTLLSRSWRSLWLATALG